MSKPFRSQLSAPGLLSEARRCFEQIPDDVANGIPLVDHLMSGLALFGFKYPSLLAFDKERRRELTRANLKALYGIERVPCDTYFRVDLFQISSWEVLYRSIEEWASCKSRIVLPNKAKTDEKAEFIGNK
uniref:Uncharacterized protein n=1 Tax=Candidatus Kentrum sp. DK TaxID=2126562 RepID=A0A450T2J3_9GAMM|nr:MAG: hypothetical protein BECKDK2373B_GA0170837_10956 [Candidatus Kentron sp. DK]